MRYSHSSTIMKDAVSDGEEAAVGGWKNILENMKLRQSNTYSGRHRYPQQQLAPAPNDHWDSKLPHSYSSSSNQQQKDILVQKRPIEPSNSIKMNKTEACQQQKGITVQKRPIAPSNSIKMNKTETIGGGNKVYGIVRNSRSRVGSSHSSAKLIRKQISHNNNNNARIISAQVARKRPSHHDISVYDGEEAAVGGWKNILESMKLRQSNTYSGRHRYPQQQLAPAPNDHWDSKPPHSYSPSSYQKQKGIPVQKRLIAPGNSIKMIKTETIDGGSKVNGILRNSRSRVSSSHSSAKLVRKHDEISLNNNDNARMISAQVARKRPSLHDIRKIGNVASRASGLNESWGNMHGMARALSSRVIFERNLSVASGIGAGLNESWGNMQQMVRSWSSKVINHRNMSCDSNGSWAKSIHMAAPNRQLKGSRNEHWDSAFSEGGLENMTAPYAREAVNSSGNNPLLLALADKTFQNGWDQFSGDNHKPLNMSIGQEQIIEAMREGSAIARGFCLANGWGGLEENKKSAFSVFSSLAVNKGDIHGMALLAYCYLNGDGVQRDLKKAIIWLTKAVELKNSFAQFLMGSCFQKGGSKEDEQQAYELFKDSAEQGYVIAMYELGHIYAAGSVSMDILPNIEEGLKWYNKACDQNHPESKEKIKELLKLQYNA